MKPDTDKVLLARYPAAEPLPAPDVAGNERAAQLEAVVRDLAGWARTEVKDLHEYECDLDSIIGRACELFPAP